MISPGIEPGTFSVLTKCDNRYTTKPDNLAWKEIDYNVHWEVNPLEKITTYVILTIVLLNLDQKTGSWVLDFGFEFLIAVRSLACRAQHKYIYQVFKQYRVLKIKMKYIQYQGFARGHPPYYWPGSNHLNFRDRTGSGALWLIWPNVVIVCFWVIEYLF